MKFLALEHEIEGSPEAYQPHLTAEAKRIWELVQAGIIREHYFQQTQHTAVLILECSRREEAERALQSLPLVQAGLIRFEIIPLVPYDGFARLFTGHKSD